MSALQQEEKERRKMNAKRRRVFKQIRLGRAAGGGMSKKQAAELTQKFSRSAQMERLQQRKRKEELKAAKKGKSKQAAKEGATEALQGMESMALD